MYLQSLKERAKAAHKIECQLAETIRGWGFDCPAPELEFGDETGRPIKDFTENQKDLEVLGLVLELKSRPKLKFTSPDDYPFPDIMIETHHGWISKKTKPDFYVVYSGVTGTFLVLPGDTRDQWQVREGFDRERGTHQKCFYAPKDLFRPLAFLQAELIMQHIFGTTVSTVEGAQNDTRRAS